MLLKPNMVIPGKKYAGGKATPDEVADATIRCFRETVPAAVPGIVFLSGGQSDEEATANLDAINKRGPHPWAGLVLVRPRAAGRRRSAAWKGQDANAAAGQKAYLHRARMNGLAADGRRGAPTPNAPVVSA